MFLPENIDLANAENYNLTIRLKPDGFSFLIQDTKDSACFTYQETVFSSEVSLLNNIKRIIFDFNFLTDSFSKVNVVVVSPDYELIPNALYDEKSIVNLYNFTRQKETTHVLTSEQLLPDCKMIFGMDDDTYLFLIRSLYNPVFYHYKSLMINCFSACLTESENSTLFVYRHDFFTDLVCFDSQRKIVCSNTYQKEDEQDMVYYILNFWVKNNLNQLTDRVVVYDKQEDGSIETSLKKYIKGIEKVGVNELVSIFGEKVRSIPLDLLNLPK